jgi:hypothetical protein
MEIEFSPEMFNDVVVDALSNAGAVGLLLLDMVPWTSLNYSILEYPGVTEYGTGYSLHVVPHGQGAGVVPSPSSGSRLAILLSEYKNGRFACADFAMPTGNPRASTAERWPVDDVMFYISDVKDVGNLRGIISMATSWSFFGALLGKESSGCQRLEELAKADLYAFSIYAGDTYLVARRLSDE